jgi:exodeoxyribonuclease VII large subunit
VARLGFKPEDGMDVRCRGEVDVYSPRGTYQLIVRQMELQGAGALQAALRQLREKLAAEGLFDPARKRPLPAFPRRLAVVTSPSGAALRDFLEVVRRRWQGVQIMVVPTRVQGSEAAPEIVAAIRNAIRLRPAPDAILVTRGGGSLKDLWGFNDEQVVRAIHASPVPIVSAVGHEIDVTLADLVADLRALTPSEAGERLVPAVDEIEHRLHTFARRMFSLLRASHAHARSRLSALANNRLFQDPTLILRDHDRLLDDLHQRSSRAVLQRTERQRSLIATYASQLESLNPLQVLARGYSLTQKTDGTIVRAATDVVPNEQIHVRLAHGKFSAIVDNVEADDR